MEFIYNLSISLVALLLIIGPIILIVLFVRPKVLSKVTKKVHSRKSIIKNGLIWGVVGVICLVITGVIFEPVSVKADRAAREKAETAQKAMDEKLRNDAFKPVIKQVESIENIDFQTVETEDGSIPKGEKKTASEGVDGERVKIYEVTYVNGIENGRELVKNEITKSAVDKVVLVGTYVAPATSRTANSSSSTPLPPQPSSTNVYYANCTAVRNAGVAPIYSGQPGYRSALDRDSDGIACE